MAVGKLYVFPGFLTPVLTELSFQIHRLLFSHSSAEVRGENTPDTKFASTGSRTHNHQKCSLGDPFLKNGREVFICRKTTADCWHLHVVLLFDLCFRPCQAYALLQETVFGQCIPKFICRILIHQNHCCCSYYRNGDRF